MLAGKIPIDGTEVTLSGQRLRLGFLEKQPLTKSYKELSLNVGGLVSLKLPMSPICDIIGVP